MAAEAAAAAGGGAARGVGARAAIAPEASRNGYSRLHGHAVDQTFTVLLLARQLWLVCQQEGRMQGAAAWDRPLAGFTWDVDEGWYDGARGPPPSGAPALSAALSAAAREDS